MLRMTGIATGLTALGLLGLASAPAAAQVEAGTHELHGFVGYLFGDDLTDTAISGSTPELDDDFEFGARYVYNFSETLGLDVSFAYNPNSATRLPGPDIDLDIMLLDVDAIWSFLPRERFVPYALAGVGYAFADLDNPITGVANGQTVTIQDDDGFTLNAGIGVRYYFTDLVHMRVEARYRYIDKLVDTFDDSLNAFEATVGVGMTF